MGNAGNDIPASCPSIEREFEEYFDIVDVKKELQDRGSAIFGCGMGRWSLMLQTKCKCREMMLVDFSESIFVARDAGKPSEYTVLHGRPDSVALQGSFR